MKRKKKEKMKKGREMKEKKEQQERLLSLLRMKMSLHLLRLKNLQGKVKETIIMDRK